MYHIFFIHIHLSMQVVSMSWLLWIVLLWIQGHMNLFRLEVCVDIYPGVGLLNHTVILLLDFWGTSILFSTVAAPTHIPTNNAREFLFSATSPTCFICRELLCFNIFLWKYMYNKALNKYSASFHLIKKKILPLIFRCFCLLRVGLSLLKAVSVYT